MCFLVWDKMKLFKPFLCWNISSMLKMMEYTNWGWSQERNSFLTVFVRSKIHQGSTRYLLFVRYLLELFSILFLAMCRFRYLPWRGNILEKKFCTLFCILFIVYFCMCIQTPWLTESHPIAMTCGLDSIQTFRNRLLSRLIA